MRTPMAVAVLALLTTGCGPGYRVDFQNQSSITIWYDPARQSMGTVQTVAQRHCDQYGKDAVPGGGNGEMWTGVNVSFLCKPRS